MEGRHQGQRDRAARELRFGFRPLPRRIFERCTRPSQLSPIRLRWRSTKRTFRGPRCPPATSPAAEERRLQARDLADALESRSATPFDFWTEASLFSRAGLTAFVYGPGDIAQAHSADEWVALEQLATVSATHLRLMSS
jgi:acetylornithine deacetylase